MVFEQFYLGCLAHASYLIGSGGVAAVVDPQRDVAIYLEAAARHGLRIQHIIETHLHADFVSGHHELAERTGATIYLGEGSGAQFPHHEVREGDVIPLGQCRLLFLKTPGHTLESVSVVVEEKGQPAAVLTGDTLFIGDVGRPDLSETHSPVELAALLYDSLHTKLLTLPDSVAVYPAHGAGSMCGRNISSESSSTIGRERASNYALQPMDKARFVEMMTHDLPARPDYFRQDVYVNRQGAPALDALPPLDALTPDQVIRLQRAGATVLDTRPAFAYASAHIHGSMQIGLGGQFAAWAGAVVGLDRDLILVAEGGAEAAEARLRLARVGMDRAIGTLTGGISRWAEAGLPLRHMPQITARDLAAELAKGDDLCVVDVRRPAEFDAGHIPGARLSPLDGLAHESSKLDPQCLTVVHCKSGYRSMIAASLLEAAGFERVVNLLGGWDAWAELRLTTSPGAR
jgi:hydroxyacylglutathione hydrolase